MQLYTASIQKTYQPPPHVALSSWGWHAPYFGGSFSLLDAPSAVRRLGFDWLECNDFMLPPPRLSRIRRPALRLLLGRQLPELWRYSRLSLERLQAALEQAQVGGCCWTLDTDFTGDARSWLLHKFYLRLGLQCARRLDVPLVRVTLGGEPTAVPAVWTRIRKRLYSCRPLLADFPAQQLVVENHHDAGNHLERLVELVAPLPNVGICLDTGNNTFTDQTLKQRLLEQVTHWHLKLPVPNSGLTLEATQRQQPLTPARTLTLEYEGANSPEAIFDAGWIRPEAGLE